jgi:hypothetical protein
MIYRLDVVIVLIIIIISTSGCKRNLRQKIIDHYNKYCTSYKCMISINDLTSFEWDEMYVFGSSSNNEFISSTVGFDYHGARIPYGFRRIIFSWGRREICEEDYKPRSYQNSVFDFKFINDSILSLRSYCFNQADAIFLIQKDKIPGSCTNCFLYNLIPQEIKK